MNWFTRRKIRKSAAARLYAVAVANARDPVLYERLGVADTIDGRFDLLTLQVVLISNRLNTLGPDGAKLAQALFDHMFRRIDLTLREMGIGDLGIPKHMKKMMKAFNGRAHSYSAALGSADPAALEEAIARNVYRTENGTVPDGAATLASYTRDLHAALQSFSMDVFLSEAFWLPPIAETRKEQAYA